MSAESEPPFFPSEPPFGPIINGTQIIVYYRYRPHMPAAYIFVAVFALATLLHLVYLFRLRAWYFIPILLGGIGTFIPCPAHRVLR